ncbi:hypothetical protein, partial [Mycolicibacterium brumae]
MNATGTGEGSCGGDGAGEAGCDPGPSATSGAATSGAATSGSGLSPACAVVLVFAGAMAALVTTWITT